MGEKIVLIDGYSILKQAFYGQPCLGSSAGRQTQAVYGFVNFLLKVKEEEKPQYLTVALDASSSAQTFRQEADKEYKNSEKIPQQLKEQTRILRETLQDMNICMAEKEGWDACDVTASLMRDALEKEMEVEIFCADRALLQLAGKKTRIHLLYTEKGQAATEVFGEEQVLETCHVSPAQIADLCALCGKEEERISGISGMGEKTAVSLLGQYHTVEGIYEHLEEIKSERIRNILKENKDVAEKNKKLFMLHTDLVPDLTNENAITEQENPGQTQEELRKAGLDSLLGEPQEVPIQESLEKDFFICNDLAGCEALFEKAAQKERIGLALLAEQKSVYGVALALDEHEIYFISAEGLLTGDYLCSKLEQTGKSTVLCALDIKSLLKYVNLENPEMVFDVQVAAYLLNPLKSAYTYEDLAEEFLNIKNMPAREKLLGKASWESAWQEEMEGLSTCACYMAYTAYACQEPVTEALQNTGMWQVYTEIERPLIFTLDSMEKEGICVKGEELKEYGQKLNVRIEELETLIWKQAGEEFNINSPKQLGVILFEKMQIPGGKKTKTGYSTAADILEKLAPDYPIVKDILEYRQLAKLKSTYADGLAGVIEKDGRIHSTFNQTITATGRISSTEPNLQNIPVRMELGRLIRKVFVPKEGCVFLDADYSQIELRVLAHMSGDEKLIQAYSQAQDIHRLTASQVFHVPFDQVTDLQRRNAKAVNFGIVYGISSFGLSQDLSITKKEAAAYIEKYFESYPKIRGFLEKQVEEGKEKGYVTTMFGRRRPVPELKSGNFRQRSFGERVTMNSPIQGTAADIIKIAMNRVYRRLKEEKLKSRLVLQVHDELLIETYKEEVSQVSAILEEEMKGAAKLSVELEVDMHQGNNWYEAK